jgi:ADP-ribose pyrophosphatase YjhB (NUDIX family)
MIVRRRGTAIVDTDKGILVASGHRKLFLLPGGGARHGESRRQAAIRELREETGLKAYYWKYLFTYHEPNDPGRKVRNLHKVFLIKAYGSPRPNHHDVHHVAFWRPGSDIHISRTTELIIKKYLEDKIDD